MAPEASDQILVAALETPVSCRFITLCGRGTCHWWPASCPAEDQHPGDRMIGPPGTDRESPGPAAYRKKFGQGIVEASYFQNAGRTAIRLRPHSGDVDDRGGSP